MTVDAIMKLLDAGYTKDEISALARDEPANDPEVSAESEQTSAETESVAADPGSDTEHSEPETDNYSELNNRLTGIETSIANMVKMIQNNNLQNDTFDSAGPSMDEQIDAIFASIIRPEGDKTK